MMLSLLEALREIRTTLLERGHVQSDRERVLAMLDGLIALMEGKP